MMPVSGQIASIEGRSLSRDTITRIAQLRCRGVS